MSNLLTLQYWFDLRPAMLVPAGQVVFTGALAALIALSIIAGLIKLRGGVYRGFWKRLYSFGLANLAIGLLLLFFNYESVPFFAARFWLGLWFLLMLAWLIKILSGLKLVARQKKERQQEEERKKYLP